MAKRSITLIGTFRKDQETLRTLLNSLKSEFNVLCPLSLDFIDPTAEFVKAKHEETESIHAIESKVLSAVLESDFIWLFAPDGYVGVSAAFEIGFAHASGIPVYTDTSLNDEMLRTMVKKVAKPPLQVDENIAKPGEGVRALQIYYKKIARRRGWSSESAQNTLLMLTEELGELARSVRKVEGLRRDVEFEGGAAEELADIQLYLAHLASILRIDLADAVTKKERINERRFISSKEAGKV